MVRGRPWGIIEWIITVIVVIILLWFILRILFPAMGIHF